MASLTELLNFYRYRRWKTE